MQGPGDQKQIRKSKHDEKENRRLRAEQYKYHCTPEHRHQKEIQSAAGIPKSWKIKFGAAGTHGNDHFRMRGLRDLAYESGRFHGFRRHRILFSSSTESR